MYYYKVTIDGVTSLQIRNHPCYGEEFTELTEEEYNIEHQKFLDTISEPIEMVEPTYEELEEENARLWYQILTGEEFE